MEENFNKLIERVLDSLEKTDLEKINYQLKRINSSTICTGVGGSFVVSNYMSKILSAKNDILAINLSPRDMLYFNRRPFVNVVCCSYSGNNYGVDVSLNNYFNKYLFSTSEKNGINNLTYDSSDKEYSFISLAATLIPMTILLNYYLDNNREIIDNIISDFHVKDISLHDTVEIMSGYDTSTAANYLESTLIESGIAVPVVHDKYSYCHGRSTLGYKRDNTLIYFNGKTELDELMILELDKYYPELYIMNHKFKDDVINDYYLTYKSMLLSQKMAKNTNSDLSKVEYSPIVKKLYKYRGEM